MVRYDTARRKEGRVSRNQSFMDSSAHAFHCPEYWNDATEAMLNDTVEQDHFDIYFREFDAIEFYRGAPYFGQELPRMLIECQNISTGFGRPEHGAPSDCRVYILKLGHIIETHNCDDLQIN